MPQEVSVVARSEDKAREVVARIKEMGIDEVENVFVADDRSEVEQLANPGSEEFRNARNGSIVGAVIALIYGAATLTVVGTAAGLLVACLILGYSVLGGVMLGAIIGSTGIFARPRTPASSERK